MKFKKFLFYVLFCVFIILSFNRPIKYLVGLPCFGYEIEYVDINSTPIYIAMQATISPIKMFLLSWDMHPTFYAFRSSDMRYDPNKFIIYLLSVIIGASLSIFLWVTYIISGYVIIRDYICTTKTQKEPDNIPIIYV